MSQVLLFLSVYFKTNGFFFTGPPEPLQDCKVTNRSSDSLSVECKPGYNGSLLQIFHLEVYNSADESIADNVTSEDTASFDVAGLFSSTSYVLVIYSSNAKGRSKSLAIVAATLSPAKRRIGIKNKSKLTQSDMKIVVNLRVIVKSLADYFI